ncbi:uncharacterized protein LOC116245057 [Nymphaea colorata]|uniref:uncharacterized protein LOC116245057 n=1 Tax=Nymphaea colorata TaxID=210225 RepID=UPI00129E45FF|nr:uncharacterized protein LOC116245057 [Nymphaea colorata]
MGNALMEQCTGESSKLEGFNGEASNVLAHPTPKMERPKIDAPPKGREAVQRRQDLPGALQEGQDGGQGHHQTAENTVYEGNFREDMRNGVGVLRTAKYEYFGPYKEDRMEGKGTVIFSDGSKFEGWFQGDRINGYGEWHRPNAPVEKGNFSLDLPK